MIVVGGDILPTERQVHRSILQMCGVAFPQMFIHHSPNGVFLGSARDKAIRGGASKGDGTKAGFPDLICLWSPGKGCCLEVKRPKLGRVSDVQADIHERLKRVQWPVAVVTSIDDAYMFLRSLGAPWSGIDPRINKVTDAYHPSKIDMLRKELIERGLGG